MKKFRKSFQRWCARNGMFASYYIFSHMPYNIFKWFISFFFFIAYKLTKRHQKVARESLNIAFAKEKTKAEIDSIVEKCFQGFCRGMMDMIYVLSHRDYILKKVNIEGLENLDKALSRGKGVVAITAHFGNFPLMMLALALKGYKVHVMMRHTRDSKVDDFLIKKRNEFGLKTIFTMPRRESVTKTLRALRANEIVFILMDQNFGAQGGVFVDFFGQKAATATGPLVLAARADAAIVPLFILSEDEGLYTIKIEEELKVEQGKGEEIIYNNTVLVTKKIESYIRQYPHEWGWMHRRWKTRPQGEEKNA